ncbi:MAG: endonuclease domain-containing protein [Chloroflexi bacterium]|nr:endonuclease domain-containing protein [Chloroflexota bacterium]
MSITSNARQLRRGATDAERVLWRYIRRKQLGGYRFRRQHPIGEFIVDFFCFEKGLVIELDGGHHSEHEDYDLNRTRCLESQGYQVLRFWNNQVMGEIEAVKQVILDKLTAT